jgi:aspartyl/asparaginyl beta-hydroxylase (cupin superfamily)
MENQTMTNEEAYAEINQILTKWNLTEKELLLVFFTTLKKHGHMDKQKEKNDK